VAEVTQEPPQPLGATHVSVRDDEDVIADTCSRCRVSKLLWIRQRMSASWPGRRRQIGVDVEEAGSRDVTAEVELAAAVRFPELPAAVGELVPHPGASLPGTLEGAARARGALAKSDR
jgi:hypothetical protein